VCVCVCVCVCIGTSIPGKWNPEHASRALLVLVQYKYRDFPITDLQEAYN
jgi:hypothetical protein